MGSGPSPALDSGAHLCGDLLVDPGLERVIEEAALDEVLLEDADRVALEPHLDLGCGAVQLVVVVRGRSGDRCGPR